VKKAKSKPRPKRVAKPAAKPVAKPVPKAPAKPVVKPARKAPAIDQPPSQLIDERIDDLEGWRGVALARVRALIHEADPAVIEEWKWGVPVWSHDGIICTGEAYKDVVKLTFAHGASVEDPSRVFNSSLEGNTRRAIDIREGHEVDAAAFKTLIKAAVARNSASAKTR
jgi:hypothetical protein